MSRNLLRIVLTSILLTFLLLAGCGREAPSPSLPAGSLAEFYPGQLSAVDRIDIRSGMTGEWRTVTDPKVIRDGLAEAGELRFSPDPSQAERTGYTYMVILLEQGEEKFSLLPHAIGEHYYISDPKLSPLLDRLFEAGTKPVPGRG
ncbi:hypothetical protein ACP26L_09245 [Paenibacillus sp. S-38]|uniref:hypothetical protein n=1 Tax=Paenibacillus sp. S-38 TaxID=3416710 RepID=UPI003CF1BDD6